MLALHFHLVLGSDLLMSDFWNPMVERRARKEHTCSTCGRKIGKGETYLVGSGIFDSRWVDWKMCAHCNVMLGYLDYDDIFSADDFCCFEPGSLTEARMFVHYRKKWRNTAGELYPIPEAA